MGLFKKKNRSSNDIPDFYCYCGGELFKMGNLYKCEDCGSTFYMDDDGDLIEADDMGEGEYMYDEVYGDDYDD